MNFQESEDKNLPQYFITLLIFEILVIVYYQFAQYIIVPSIERSGHDVTIISNFYEYSNYLLTLMTIGLYIYILVNIKNNSIKTVLVIISLLRIVILVIPKIAELLDKANINLFGLG